MRKHIPNAITLINAVLGCLAIISLLQGDYWLFCILLGGAALADFADGLFARLLKVSSPLGKELDSLADAISFGFIPGMIFYVMLVLGDNPVENQALLWQQIHWYAAPAFLLTAFSLFRLARFNLDTRQTEDFIGMATPANTVLAVGLLLIYIEDAWGLQSIISQKWLLYFLIGTCSYLLNSNIPMFSFKLKSLSWTGNEHRIIFAFISVILLFVYKALALAPIVLIYIFINIFINLNPKQR